MTREDFKNPPDGMKLSGDTRIVDAITERLLVDAHCPCSLIKDETTVCPCLNCRENHICKCGLFVPCEEEK